MPKDTLCKIATCSKPVRAKGLCKAHYQRLLRHGDPLKGRTGHGDPRRFIEQIAIPYIGDDCLIWPYARSGTEKRESYFNDGTGMKLVAREVCRRVHGEPPTPKHETAHSCGKGHTGCIAPRHLSWKTHVENEADKIGHGTKLFGSRVGTAKLREAQVMMIYGQRGVVSAGQLADQYGVHVTSIWHIWNGKRWGWLTRPQQHASVPAQPDSSTTT